MTPLAFALNQLSQGEPAASLQGFPTGGKHPRPAAIAGSSHSASVTKVRTGTTQGRRPDIRRRALSFHSVTLGVPARTGAIRSQHADHVDKRCVGPPRSRAAPSTETHL